MSPAVINYNGAILPSNLPCLQFNDRSFTLGHGIFETLLIKKNLIPLKKYHWQRLAASALQLGIEVPFSAEKLELMLLELVEHQHLQDKIAGARITVSSGYSERGILPASGTKANFIICVFEHIPLIKDDYSALIVTTRKNEHSLTSGIKSTSYLDNIMARQEAASQGYDEAILLNTSGQVADGAISNVFMVKEGKISTPSLKEGALPGVIRRVLLEECSNEFTILEQSIGFQDLLEADEVFLTNALMGIQRVTLLNQKTFSQFTCTNKIRERFRRLKDYI